MRVYLLKPRPGTIYPNTPPPKKSVYAQNRQCSLMVAVVFLHGSKDREVFFRGMRAWMLE